MSIASSIRHHFHTLLETQLLILYMYFNFTLVSRVLVAPLIHLHSPTDASVPSLYSPLSNLSLSLPIYREAGGQPEETTSQSLSTDYPHIQCDDNIANNSPPLTNHFVGSSVCKSTMQGNNYFESQSVREHTSTNTLTSSSASFTLSK